LDICHLCCDHCIRGDLNNGQALEWIYCEYTYIDAGAITYQHNNTYEHSNTDINSYAHANSYSYSYTNIYGYAYT